MSVCKKCGSSKNIKSGKVNDKQRYECKECGCHFMEGDARTNEKIKAKKALCVLLYSHLFFSYVSKDFQHASITCV